MPATESTANESFLASGLLTNPSLQDLDSYVAQSGIASWFGVACSKHVGKSPAFMASDLLAYLRAAALSS